MALNRLRLVTGAAMLLGIAALGGCGDNARSADYFAAHEADAHSVVDACAAGTTRGAECVNADTGLKIINGKKAYQHANFPTTGGKGY